MSEGGPPECAGRSHEAAGNGRPRWMVANRVVVRPRGEQNPAYEPAHPRVIASRPAVLISVGSVQSADSPQQSRVGSSRISQVIRWPGIRSSRSRATAPSSAPDTGRRPVRVTRASGLHGLRRRDSAPHGRHSVGDHVAINEACIDQGEDEVPVLLAERAQLRDTEVVLVEAPAGEDGLASGGCRVGVLHLDEAITPARRKCGGLQVHTVDAEPVHFLEMARVRRPLLRCRRRGERSLRSCRRSAARRSPSTLWRGPAMPLPGTCPGSTASRR